MGRVDGWRLVRRGCHPHPLHFVNVLHIAKLPSAAPLGHKPQHRVTKAAEEDVVVVQRAAMWCQRRVTGRLAHSLDVHVNVPVQVC